MLGNMINIILTNNNMRARIYMVIITLIGAGVFFIAGGLVSILKAQENEGTALPQCGEYTSSTAVPAGYAAAYNPFNPTEALLTRVLCTTSLMSLRAGRQNTVGATWPITYTYSRGYVYRDGGPWQSITLAPRGISTKVEEWINGAGEHNESILSTDAGKTIYFVAYTCQWINNAWKCGCRDATCAGSTGNLWQLQKVTVPGGSSGCTSDTQCQSMEVCTSAGTCQQVQCKATSDCTQKTGKRIVCKFNSCYNTCLDTFTRKEGCSCSDVGSISQCSVGAVNSTLICGSNNICVQQ
ncbi:MAG: hypothetical protein G01um101470_44 [Parcubacteria group bacterium Gr01-1014_70]|nr:MAG: hypothetical protein G01um101470_44 [Parcubacteria group bacterium Gr01-1014_70]